MKKTETKKIDAVFEGGGVKGSAFVGAIQVTEDLGYSYENLAGTSAGAIVAALLAAGFNAAELKQTLDTVDYKKFTDETFLDRVPLIGKPLNVLLTKGLYKGDYFMGWIGEILASRGIRKFKDLIIPEYASDPRYRYKLQVVASDVSLDTMIVLPRDAALYGINPDELSVPLALRMSMSIPFFFRPVVITTRAGAEQFPFNPVYNQAVPQIGDKSYIVDGGMLSNFPVFIFDDGTPDPAWPTIGYKFVDTPHDSQPRQISGVISYIEALLGTAGDNLDKFYLKTDSFVRTIPIETLGISGENFSITQAQKDQLYASGQTAAKNFFETWNFEQYKKLYRKQVPPTRTEQAWTRH